MLWYDIFVPIKTFCPAPDAVGGDKIPFNQIEFHNFDFAKLFWH